MDTGLVVGVVAVAFNVANIFIILRIKNSILQFEKEFLEKLNGRYLRKEDFNSQLLLRDERIDRIIKDSGKMAGDLEGLHRIWHNWRNAMTQLLLKFDIEIPDDK